MRFPVSSRTIRPRRRALGITAAYAILAALWIYASDAFLGLVISDSVLFAALSTYKGLIFVAITSALLYYQLGAEKRVESPSEEIDGSLDDGGFSIMPPLLTFVVFAGLVAATGYLVYTSIADAARSRSEETLGAIADLKVRQIEEWLEERRATAERASHDPFMAGETEAWLARGAPDDQTAARLRARLETLRSTHDWSTVFLVDTQGEVRLDPRNRQAHSALSKQYALQAIASRGNVFWNFHRAEAPGGPQIELAFFAPLLLGSGPGARAVGVLVMEMDPARYLYPLMENWPLPSRSGETLLVARDGDSVVYLNRLRHRKEPPLSLRLPASAASLVAARAVRGEIGTLTGLDYRGIPVLAAARRVPHSPWILVAKLDRQEVNGPVIASARLVALFGIVLVLAAGLTTALWLRQQRSNALVRQLRAERERTALAKHLDYLTRYANDMIFLIDEGGRLVDANERAVAAYGYAREELIGMHVRSLRAPDDLTSFASQWERARQQDGIVFETVHLRKDGTTFPAEVSTRAIEVDGVQLRQSIVRDITERHEAQRKILRLSNLYAALSQMNQAIVRGHDRDSLLTDICRIAVEFGKLQLAWIGLIDESSRMVRVAARYGDDAGYLDQIQVSTDPEKAVGRGPIGIAIREQRTYVSGEFSTDPVSGPWREAAAQAGFRSVAAVPLRHDSKVIGSLTVYSSEPGFFDDATVELLEEMTDDVAFALDGLTREERRRSAEEALRESEEKYRLLFNNEQDAIVIFEAASGRIIDGNEAFLRLSGYTAEEAGRLNVRDISAEPEATSESLRKLREQGFDQVEARRFRRKNGDEIWVELGLNTFEWRGRQLVSAIVRDITERKRAEENALLWSKVLEDSTEGIVITDAQGNILTVNKAFSALTGYTPEEVVGKDPKLLASGRHDKGFYHVMWRTIRESGRWQGEIWNRRKNGEVYLEWLSITGVRNSAGELTHYVGIFTDITERKESAERIQFLANHDFLTGLPNRSLMKDLVQQSLATARRKGSILALLLLDLDRFKTINDSLGHGRGDALLQRVATRLVECVREGDTIARLGGDEFLIMLPELPRSQDAALVAEKISTAMRKHIFVEGHELGVTASIGISVFPHDGNDVDSLTRNAEAAMYHAKDRGRNNYQYFTSDMNERAFEALAMEMSLRGAIERNEFTLHYQPQVQTGTGVIVGAEALIRWRHPDLGFVPPGRFIPIAEEHGLIVQIGEWVLRTACSQVRAWLDEGLPAVPVAVNMSAVQFRQAGLAKRVGQILAQEGVEPRFIELELTETIIMREAEQTIAVLAELHDMGVSLSIDDFGTGYSSLSYLRRFPIHKLKIDQSFVRDITNNPDAAAIATAIISMGRSMKLRVIAEGVETAEQLAFLSSKECDELQGFHIGRPMEADRFSALLRDGKPIAVAVA